MKARLYYKPVILTKNHPRFATVRHTACKRLVKAYNFRVHVY